MSLIKQKYIKKYITTKHTKFSNSKNGMTRKYCAYYGYDLDKLQYDKKWYVRIEVVRKGYNVNQFLDDKDKRVRNEAKKALSQ